MFILKNIYFSCVLMVSLLLTACGGGDAASGNTGDSSTFLSSDMPTKVVFGTNYAYTSSRFAPTATQSSWSWGDGTTDSSGANVKKTWFPNIISAQYNATLTTTVNGVNTVTSLPVSVVGSPLVQGRLNGGHACAINNDATVSCWGRGVFGELGNGTATTANTPVQVSNLSGVVGLSSGEDRLCALRKDGSIWCWGRNSSNSLGNGTSVDQSNVPVQVSGINDAIQVVSGEAHACALLVDNTVKCWGSSNAIGYKAGDHALDQIISSSVPLVLPGLNGKVKMLAAGQLHTCALMFDKTVQCWGADYSGETGSTPGENKQLPTTVPTLSDVNSIYAGTKTSCAIKVDGSVWCWGRNDSGQLGNGQVVDWTLPGSNGPVQVQGLSTAASIALNDNTSCALLLDGTVKCWGALGDIWGDGSSHVNEVSTKPIAIGDLTGVTQVSVNGHIATLCALRNNGSVWCVGSNVLSTLGQPDAANVLNSYKPIQVSAGTQFWH